MQAKGSNSRLVLDFENGYGVEPSPTTGKALPFNSINAKGSVPLKTPATISSSRNPVEPYEGNEDVTGDVVVPVDLRAMGYWLKAIFGVPTTTGAGPTYQHVFKVGDTQPSIILERQFLDVLKYFRKAGLKINRWAIGVGGGDDELTTSFSVVGKKEEKKTTPYGALSTVFAGDVVAADFTGAGLNDATSGGAYTGTGKKTFRVQIEHAAATDKFKWSNDGGATWEAEDVSITGAAQTLEEGVTVTFGATTGHTEGDFWDIVTGLNDATVARSPLCAGTSALLVKIDHIGATDSFKWSNDGGATWEDEDVAITGAAQTLENGITILFAATTGHTVDDAWTISANGPDVVALDRLLRKHATLQEGGVDCAIGREFSLDLAMGLDTEDFRIGGAGQRSDIPEGAIEVKGNVKVIFQDTALLDKAIAGTETNLQLALTKDAKSLTILIPELKFERNNPVVEGPKGILADLNFHGFYVNGADASAVKVTLVNDVASYA